MIRRLCPLILVLLVACGQERAGIGQSASAALNPQVQQVRAAAASGDRARAAQELAELRETVADLREQGELSEAGAARVLAAAAEVEARLAAGTTAPTQVAPTTPSQSDPEWTTRTAREAEQEARKRADEAVRQAEEAARKAVEEAKRRADEARRRAGIDDDD